MNGLISTIRCRYKLFKQPDQVGDVVEIDGKFLLIIGIERFELVYQTLSIWYTCQDLSQSEYFYTQKSSGWNTNEVELEAQFKFDDDRWKFIKPGLTTTGKDGNVYKFIEYTEISLKSTDLYVSMIAKRVDPVERKRAKAKFLDERRKKLKLEVH